MSHQLDFVKNSHILRAIEIIDIEGVPKNNEWSEYWIKFKHKFYQFKYTVHLASSFTDHPIISTDFTSNDSSRNYIAQLGFLIVFRSPNHSFSNISYWIGASYYGLGKNMKNMFEDFLKNKYWGTDHDLTKGEGAKVYDTLKNVKVNDRISIRYLDKKGGTIEIAAVGTVNGIDRIDEGRLDVKWDYNPKLYSGQKPSGQGSGNWWRTLFQLKRHNDISLIFNDDYSENRVARLTWNIYGWVYPSGPKGKSNNPDSHEAKFGYGHEEWLFDMSKVIDGYHYGFLEPIRKEQNAFSGNKYNVWLFTIDGESKKRYWVGEINNLIVLNETEADDTYKFYKEKGWIDEMEEEIKESGANEIGFSNWVGIDLFNVKFKQEDFHVNDPIIELDKNHPVYEQSRYSFIHFKDDFEIIGEQTDIDFKFEESTGSEVDEDDSIQTKTHTRKSRSVEIIYLHKAISKALTKELRRIYGYKNVTPEHKAGYGANRIDIVVNNKGTLLFYEIKTYNSQKTSIREALGQLIEYCYYPENEKATELIVVTHVPANKNTKRFFEHLRKVLGIKVYYQSFDIETDRLSIKS